jgi:hypothetical protein
VPIVLTIAALALLALQAPAPPNHSLLILDEPYPEKEVAQLTTQTWQGLFLDGASAPRIAPVTLELGERGPGCPVEDAVVEVRSRPAGAQYAVTSRAIRAGAVTTVRRDYPASLSASENREISLALGNRRYVLRREGVRDDLADARVVLTEGGATQVLFERPEVVDEPHFTLHWAGDLDRDGRLDLIVTLSHKYSVFPTRLLLSSGAQASALVGVAARLDRSAC